ncbi:MAG: hypothetical protein NC132_04225 [Corallococcus sp.]|nr:hypothetical protein [Corallococcus sp.]MCM1359866.1 hypothetical protein [Corallococcus sp.]MCM1395300.1 hypothetical protein [Corallococcus sp.]
MNFFGTDGIRGTYGSTITDGTAFLLGKSLASLGGDCPIVLIARDTRTSGESLFNALSQGVYDGGGNVINLGILPTNSVGHFVRKMGGDYGVMISASHNPPCDNGLKVFDRYGVKLCGAKQDAVSRIMNGLASPLPQQNRVFEPVFYDIENIYCDDVLDSVGVDLSDVKIALDCCYGASYKVARMLFVKAHAHVTAFCDKNDGKRINVDCGATHTEYLLSKLQNSDYRLGFAFDGDADRLAVFEGDRFIPNNKVFFAMAKYLHYKGLLNNDIVCGTILTNGGVEKALNKHGITLLRSDVGDTNVFNLMVKNKAVFGGEESGHYLLSNFATSSDALINALFVSKIYKEVGSLSEYARECVDVPYVMKSIPLSPSNEVLASPQSLAGTSKRISALYPDCRIVIRKSGTENKVRAYAEGDNAQKVIDCVAATFAQQVVRP